MSVFTSLYWKRILNGRMIVDIEHPCFLNGAIFIPAISGTESDISWLPARCKSLFRCRLWSMESPCITFILSLPKKPTGVKLITFSAYSSLSIVNCAVLIQMQGNAWISFHWNLQDDKKRFKFLNCQHSGIWNHHETRAGWKCICSRYARSYLFLPWKYKSIASILIPLPSSSLGGWSIWACSCIVKAAYNCSIETLIMWELNRILLSKLLWAAENLSHKTAQTASSHSQCFFYQTINTCTFKCCFALMRRKKNLSVMPV